MSRTLKTLVSIFGLILVGIAVFFFVGRKSDIGLFASKKTCPPLLSPVDVAYVTSVLYPGQTRGGHYKAHGGFRMDGLDNGATVRAPLDAQMINAGRYIEIGETQYIFDFKTDCGLEYRFDHLRTLSPKLQAVVSKLPEAKEGNSNTHSVRPSVVVTAGEILASEVGFAQGDHGPNVSFDFGLYDRRKKNEVSKDPAWAELHKDNKYQAFHAVCWLDWLPAADSALLRQLPGGDFHSGKQSDYCR